MANQGAKKRKEENTRHMARIRRIIIACNVIYVVIRMLIFHSSFTWKHWIGLVVTSLAYYFPYQQLAKMANPSYADDGELLDGGFDMTTGGVCGYLHDVIYITSFVQVASIISGKFWYIYLVVRYQHLEHTNPLASLKDFCHKVVQRKLKMKRPAKRGKSWRRRHPDLSLSRPELDSLLECNPSCPISTKYPKLMEGFRVMYNNFLLF
ncbi:unnamed protein product [Trifolium pratense]|uniref:Uncharacterized protein n=1 Tax=Trifolium pratense TaxID=57577 RepID=A0ACB0IN88_TRIPR|nr:unnamed protein product [Trifolium pratense]